MRAFDLKIVTPDGLIFDGEAEELVVRTTTGDLGILAGHINCVAPLGMGTAAVITGGVRRLAACIGGMVTVLDGKVTLVPSTFEWAEAIDRERARNAESRARDLMNREGATGVELRLAEARLKRSLVRESVADTFSNRNN